MKVVYLGAEVGFEACKEVFAADPQVSVVHCEATHEEVSAALTEADGLLDASMKTKLSDEMLKSAPALKIISCATTGSDHISRAVLDERGVPVRTLREDRELLLNLTPAAEMTWALLMACIRKIPAALDHVRDGGWTRELFPGAMLNGRRLGLIGCGRIGMWMARYAHAFGMDVVGHDPFVEEMPPHVAAATLEEVVSSSDVVSVHVHLTDETRGLISAELFNSMKPGAIFLNTSRGAIADESALLEGLQSGHLGGAGLDVLVSEPDTAADPLVAYARDHDNLMISPHCGGFSPDAVRVVCTHAAGKIRQQLLTGEA